MAREFHKAVWSHPKRDYAAGKDAVGPMVGRLAEAGFELIIPCLKVSGPVSYQSKIAQVDSAFADWDPLEVLAGEADKAGVKVHPWFCVFPEAEESALLVKNPDLAARDPEGNAVGWACPVAEQTQEYELSLYEEAMGYDVAGVHLDYIRHKGPDMCYCHRCRSGFNEQNGIDPVRVDRRDVVWEKWLEWRVRPITQFVERLREAAQAKGKEVSAAVFSGYPDSVVGVGQDWADWGRRKLVDLMLPMNYTTSTLVARYRTRTHLAVVEGQVPVWEGLGKRSSASHLPTRNLIEQVEACLEEGAEGVALFAHAGVTDEDLDALKKL